MQMIPRNAFGDCLIFTSIFQGMPSIPIAVASSAHLHDNKATSNSTIKLIMRNSTSNTPSKIQTAARGTFSSSYNPYAMHQPAVTPSLLILACARLPGRECTAGFQSMLMGKKKLIGRGYIRDVYLVEWEGRKLVVKFLREDYEAKASESRVEKIHRWEAAALDAVSRFSSQGVVASPATVIRGELICMFSSDATSC